jgi:uncharacterized protein (TIGR00369 family)
MLKSPDQTSLEIIERATERSPMTRWLSLKASIEEGQLLYRLAFRERHIGNPIIRAIHGGVISAFLETAASLEIKSRTEDVLRLRTISVHTNYLRGAVDKDMLARVKVARLGRRIAFLEATGWQTTEDEPVARAAVALRVFAEG